MKKMLFAAFAACMLSVAPAQARDPFPVFAGVAAGTVVGFGLAEGWFVSNVSSSASLGISGPGIAGATGAIAGGLVVGIGTMVLIHSVTTPCHGFRIAVDTCHNGRPVQARRAVRVRG